MMPVVDAVAPLIAELPLPGAPRGIRAVYTLRGEVDASDPYSGFNMCHYVGDSPYHVERSRARFAEAMGVSPLRIVVPRQTHSVNAVTVCELPAEPEDVDGVVTSLRGTLIGVSTADCVPVVLADTQAGVIGALHAGWRGALAGIVERTVAEMERNGAEPSRIIAAMGPCICGACFEVGEEVACRFPDETVIRTLGERPHVDLPAYVARELERCSLRRDAIAPPPACSRCRPQQLFSARALGAASGRIFTAIMLL